MRNGNVGGGSPRYDAVEKRIVQQFKNLDKDEDLKVSKDEIYIPLVKEYAENGYKLKGMHSSEDTIETLLAGKRAEFEKYDVNKDGHLNIDEYGAMVREQYTEEYLNRDAIEPPAIQRLLNMMRPDPITGIKKDASGKIQYTYDYEYDTSDNIIKEIYKDASGNTETTEYDANDNPIRTIKESASGNTETIEHNPSGSGETRIIKDASGNLIKTVQVYKDDSGNIADITEYEYDASGNTIKAVYKDGSDNITATYDSDYDASGNLIKEIKKGASGKIQYTEYYEYDTSGNMIKRIYKGASGNTETIEYDENGNAIRAIKKGASGNTETTEYDENGNSIETIRKDRAGNIIK
ncbi:MAG: hypothetical protein LBK53_08295 [Heliobacteriaceae bacterium]|jgi:YD repeat-containing protein|nr:hypothetical protein [Heliobacteriaceae bacterium]